MLLRSNPPGALVYVDDYEIGRTPIATNFTYYGNRKIRLVKDGYETLSVLQPVPAPWYQIPPLDFISENLVPGQVRDEHTFTYQLRPQRILPPDELLARAEGLRRESHAAAAALPARSPGSPIPAPIGPTAPPPEAQPVPQTGPAPPGIGGLRTHPLPPGAR